MSIYTNPGAVHALLLFFLDQLKICSVVELGSPQHLLLTVTTGRNEVVWATIRLSSPSGATFTTSDAVLDGEGWWHTCLPKNLVAYYPSASSSLATGEDSLTLAELAQDSSVSLAIPHSDASAFTSMVIDLDHFDSGSLI